MASASPPDTHSRSRSPATARSSAASASAASTSARSACGSSARPAAVRRTRTAARAPEAACPRAARARGRRPRRWAGRRPGARRHGEAARGGHLDERGELGRRIHRHRPILTYAWTRASLSTHRGDSVRPMSRQRAILLFADRLAGRALDDHVRAARRSATTSRRSTGWEPAGLRRGVRRRRRGLGHRARPRRHAGRPLRRAPHPDRRRRRDGLGLSASALAPNAYAYAARAFVAGIGGAGVPVAGMTSLLREFAPEERGMALGWRQLAVPLGGALGSVGLPALVASAASARDAGRGAAPASSPASGSRPSRRDDRSAVRSRASAACSRSRRCGSCCWSGSSTCGALGGVLTYYIPAAKSRRADGDAGRDRVHRGQHHRGGLAHRVGPAGRQERRHAAHARAAGDRPVAAAAAVVMPIALATGVVTSLPRPVVLAFGVFGFNGVLYLTAGRDRRRRPRGPGGRPGVDGRLRLGIAVRSRRGLAIEATGYDAVLGDRARPPAAGRRSRWMALDTRRPTYSPRRAHTRWIRDGGPSCTLITLGGLLGAVVALTIGANDIAVLTIGLSGLTSAALGYRMSRLGAGAAGARATPGRAACSARRWPGRATWR